MIVLPRARAARVAFLSALAAAAILLVTATAGRAACPGECSIPGRGSQSTECFVEHNGPAFNFPAAPKSPKRVRCSDGDPSCDLDGEVNDAGRLRIATCLNNTDSRVHRPRRSVAR